MPVRPDDAEGEVVMKRLVTSRWMAAAILTVSTLGVTAATGPSPARMAAAAMTSSGNQNPSLTYMALTARACHYAVEQLKRGDL